MTDDTHHDTDDTHDNRKESTADRIADLEAIAEEQADRIETLEARLADTDDGNGGGDQEPIVNRRNALKAGGLVGLLGLGAGTASADPQGQIGTSSDPLEALYTEELNGGVTGGQTLTDLAGSNLSINGGALEASGGSSSELVTSGNGDTAFQVVDGTSDVSNPPSSIDAPNVVGGHPDNETTGGPKGAFIGGGGRDGTENTVSANYTTIGGGIGNEASGLYATVGGGFINTASDSFATVGGGKSNTADGRYSFVAGRLADTNGNDGAFVWGDSTPSSVTAGAADQVVFQAGGGFAIEAGGLSVEGGNLDLNGNNLETSSGGLTVTTNDNGDLTLDPGRSNQLVLNNQSTASSGSLLAIDGSGNVVEASSKTLGDVGGGGGSSSELVTSGNTAFQVVDGGSNVSNAGSNIDAPNVVGGHPNNKTENGPRGAFIGGGGRDGTENTVNANYTTIGGGIGNEASSPYATVGGGNRNTASGKRATIPGGGGNTADGEGSFAAGTSADTNGNNGAFVWGDSSIFAVTADATDQAVFQAGGGMKVYTDSDTVNNTGAELPSGSGSWTSFSTKTAKSDIEPVNGPDALAAVESLDIATWRYDAEDEDIRHMGPMAEDFHDAFGLGHDEQRISNVDADGVALAAIQGLSQQLDDTQAELDAKDDRIDDLEAENADLRAELDAKDDRIDDLRAENETLRERVAAIEAHVGLGDAGGEVVADD